MARKVAQAVKKAVKAVVKAPEPVIEAPLPDDEAVVAVDQAYACVFKCFHKGKLWRVGDVTTRSRIEYEGKDGAMVVPPHFELQA